MAPDRRDLSTVTTDSLIGKAGQRAILHRVDDADSSQMRYEVCLNQSASVADATGYSTEEPEVESTRGEAS